MNMGSIRSFDACPNFRQSSVSSNNSLFNKSILILIVYRDIWVMERRLPLRKLNPLHPILTQNQRRRIILLLKGREERSLDKEHTGHVDEEGKLSLVRVLVGVVVMVPPLHTKIFLIPQKH